MVIEIKFDRAGVLVRRFGQDALGSWAVVLPGQQDRSFTGLSYDELRRIGEGIWEFRNRAG